MSILSLSGLSCPCSLTSNLAALGLNPSWIYISWSHKAITSGHHSQCTHFILCITSQGIILWWNVPAKGNSMFAYSALEFWLLMFYIMIIVYYDFALCSIWFFLLLRDTRICLRLTCTLWSRCWASPHQPSHLGSGQTTMSTTDMSCYCHCDDYSSGRELQCPLTMIKSLQQLTKLGNPLHLHIVMTLSPLWATGSVAWWEIAELYFYLPHSVVSQTQLLVCPLGLIN